MSGATATLKALGSIAGQLQPVIGKAMFSGWALPRINASQKSTLASYSFFTVADIPGTTPVTDGPLECGVNFQVSVPGVVTAIRFYKTSRNTGKHNVNFWSPSGLISSVASLAETGSGWQQVAIPPVKIIPDVMYTASYSMGSQYAWNQNYFTGPIVRGPITLLAGVYTYTTVPSYPTNVYQGTNYWVDVVFVTGSDPLVYNQAQVRITSNQPKS